MLPPAAAPAAVAGAVRRRPPDPETARPRGAATTRRRRSRTRAARTGGAGRWTRRVLLALLVVLALLVGTMLFFYTRIEKVDALRDYDGRPGAGVGHQLADRRLGQPRGAQPTSRSRTCTSARWPAAAPTRSSCCTSRTSGEPTLVSLPRDSYVPIPGHGRNKLNAAYAFGGAPLLAQTVETVTGLHIDHYAEVGFGGFVGMTDAVGGVELCPKRKIRDRKSGLDVAEGLPGDGRRDRAGATSGPATSTRRATSAGCSGSRSSSARSSTRRPARPRCSTRSAILSLGDAATTALTIDEGDGPWSLVRFALTMRAVAGGGGQRITVPVADPNYRTPSGAPPSAGTGPEALDLFRTLAHQLNPAPPARRRSRKRDRRPLRTACTHGEVAVRRAKCADCDAARAARLASRPLTAASHRPNFTETLFGIVEQIRTTVRPDRPNSQEVESTRPGNPGSAAGHPHGTQLTCAAMACRGSRHRLPRLHRRRVDPRDADPRQRRQRRLLDGRPRDDLVRLHAGDRRHGLRPRPHLRLPHQPGGHRRAGGNRQVRLEGRARLRSGAGRRRDGGRAGHRRNPGQDRGRPRSRHDDVRRQHAVRACHLRRVHRHRPAGLRHLRCHRRPGSTWLGRAGHRLDRLRHHHRRRPGDRRIAEPGPLPRPDARRRRLRCDREVVAAAGLLHRRVRRR